LISDKLGQRLDTVRIDQLGTASRVTVSKDTTIIAGGGGDHKRVEERTREIRQQIEETTSDWDKEKLQERLAKLTGGVAVIKVGAVTEAALKERKARVEDALAATRAAIEAGIVVGGGVALVRAQRAVDVLALKGDEGTGARILSRALAEPVRVIAMNAGEEGGVVVQRVRELTGNEGYDAVSGTYGDLVAQGVIDPTKVVVSALTNAASIATMVLTTEALVAEAPEKDEPAAAGHSHGGGMGDLDDMDY